MKPHFFSNSFNTAKLNSPNFNINLDYGNEIFPQVSETPLLFDKSLKNLLNEKKSRKKDNSDSPSEVSLNISFEEKSKLKEGSTRHKSNASAKKLGSKRKSFSICVTNSPSHINNVNKVIDVKNDHLENKNIELPDALRKIPSPNLMIPQRKKKNHFPHFSF
jgi:hypothetical protein